MVLLHHSVKMYQELRLRTVDLLQNLEVRTPKGKHAPAHPSRFRERSELRRPMYICRASSCQMELWVAQRRATSTICFCYAPMFARLLSVPHRKKDGCSRKVQSAKHAKEAKSSVTLRRRREARGRYGATWRSIGTKMKS
jgi:hypothetical protein